MGELALTHSFAKDANEWGTRPVYTISKDGIWKITPSGQMTHEVDADLLNGFDYKTCECKKK